MTNSGKEKEEIFSIKLVLSKRPSFDNLGALRTWVEETLSFLPDAARENLLKMLGEEKEKKN